MLEQKHISELWIRMAAIYGHKWVSSYGPSDETGTWFAALQNLEPSDLAHGLNNCIRRSRDNRKCGDEDWPPSLGEFLALCEPPRAIREFPREPHFELTDEQKAQRRADLARLRKELGFGKPREPGSDDDRDVA